MERFSMTVIILMLVNQSCCAPPKHVSHSSTDIISHVKRGGYDIDVEFCDVNYGKTDGNINETYVITDTDDIVYKSLIYEDGYQLAPFLACEHDWLLGPYIRMARGVIISTGKVDMDAIRQVISGNGTIDPIKQFVMQQKGVFALTALGLLIAVVMPVVALCFCCCRCKGRCGGRFTVQMARKQTKGQCATVTIIFLITFSVLLVGSGSLYTVGLRMLHTKDQLLHIANFILDDVILYKDEIFNHLDQVASADLASTVEYIDVILEDAGVRISDSHFSPGIATTKNGLETSLDSLVPIIVLINSRFIGINATIAAIQAEYTSMDNTLANVRTKIQTMFDSCPGNGHISGCTLLPESGNIATTFDFSQTPDMTNQLTFLHNLQAFDVVTVKNEIFSAFDTIPERLQNSTVPVITDVNATLRGIASGIGPQLVDMRSTIDNATQSVNDLKDGIHELNNSTDHIIRLGDYVFMGLSGVILFILFISLCAFIHALCGIRHIFIPEKRSAFIHCGRNCLMMGVGLSFLFAFLFFLVGAILFFLGAQLTMICEPIQDRSILQFIDDPSLFDNEYLLGKAILGNGSIDLTASRIISDCESNKAVYSTLMLNHVFDVSNFVDIQAQMPNMTDLYQLIETELAAVTVVTNATADILIALNNTPALPFDVPSLMSGLMTGQANLLTVLTGIKQRIHDAKTYVEADDAGYGADYLIEKNKVQALLNYEALAIIGNVTLLNDALTSLEQDLLAAASNVEDILVKAINFETFIHNPGPSLMVQGVETYIEGVIFVASEYINHISQRLNNDVGRCHVVYDIYNGIQFSLCSFFLDSFNGLWLSVCVIAVFLIPHIILSVKLSRFFRRPDDASSYLRGQLGQRMPDSRKRSNRRARV